MSSSISEVDAKDLSKRLLEVGSGSKKVVELYSEIGNGYEEVTSKLNYSAPKKATEQVSAILKDNFDAKILDVAAGSGLAGLELHKLGYTNIDAVDPSEGLLEIARSRGLYKKIMCEFVAKDPPLPVDNDTYDLAVIVGAMGENHLPLSALDEVVRIVRPGGHIINVFRLEAIQVPMYQGKFDAHLSKLEEEGKWKQITRQEFPCFLDTAPGLILVHQIL